MLRASTQRVLAMGNVVPLTIPAKEVHGQRRNVKWRITYQRALKHWSWEVEVAMLPQIFHGTAATQAEAQMEVDRYLKTMTV